MQLRKSLMLGPGIGVLCGAASVSRGLSSAALKQPHANPHAASLKTGILVHGYHLEAAGWEHVMWGDESRQSLGRLPHLVKVAAQEDPAVVVFSTGASERDGKKEGEVIFDYLQSRWHELPAFRGAFDGHDLERLRARLLPRCVINTEPLNTRQELAAAAAVFARAGVTRVILVSSPTHVPRCLRDASALWSRPQVLAPQQPQQQQQQRGGLRGGASATAATTADAAATAVAAHGEPTAAATAAAATAAAPAPAGWAPSVLLASPCDTSYPGFAPEDVAIVEPPHRGDRDPALDELPLHALTNRVFRVSAADRPAFQRELHELLQRYGS